VQVPFGARKSSHGHCAGRGIGAHKIKTDFESHRRTDFGDAESFENLARWIGEYYCCAPETALKSVLPEAIRKEKEGWKKQRFVRRAAIERRISQIAERQQDVGTSSKKRHEILLAELLELPKRPVPRFANSKIVALLKSLGNFRTRSLCARNHFTTQSIVLNPAQAKALGEITKAMGGTGVSPVALSVPLKAGLINEPTARNDCFRILKFPVALYHVTWQTHNKLLLSPEARQKTLDAAFTGMR